MDLQVNVQKSFNYFGFGGTPVVVFNFCLILHDAKIECRGVAIKTGSIDLTIPTIVGLVIWIVTVHERVAVSENKRGNKLEEIPCP